MGGRKVLSITPLDRTNQTSPTSKNGMEPRRIFLYFPLPTILYSKSQAGLRLSVLFYPFMSSDFATSRASNKRLGLGLNDLLSQFLIRRVIAANVGDRFPPLQFK